MDRRTPPSPLVLSHNSSLLHQRNAFSPHLWYRGSHPGRDRGAVTADSPISTSRERGRNKRGARNSIGKRVCCQGSSRPTATTKISPPTLPTPRLSPEKDNQNDRRQQALPN
ncbi:hypothetical protein CR513_23842, partial [Mucuna pruriens]